jgi:hypothetical protein
MYSDQQQKPAVCVPFKLGFPSRVSNVVRYPCKLIKVSLQLYEKWKCMHVFQWSAFIFQKCFHDFSYLNCFHVNLFWIQIYWLRMQASCCEVKPIINIALSTMIVSTCVSLKIPNIIYTTFEVKVQHHNKNHILCYFRIVWVWQWQWEWECSWNLWSHIWASSKSKLRLDQWETKWNSFHNFCRPSVINSIQIRPLLLVQNHSNRESWADTFFQWHASRTKHTGV